MDLPRVYSLFTLREGWKLMLLTSSQFGELNIAEDQVIAFPKGIPGFLNCKTYAVIQLEDTLFSYLQSIENPSVGFIIVDPFLFFPEYDFELPEITVEELGIESTEQVMIRCIVTVQSDFRQSTINLLAPIVINSHNRQGKQLVLQRVPYQIKQPLFE